MFNSDLWSEIFQSIGKNKLRTVLSGFTISFAILIFMLLFGISNGLKNTFNNFFLDDATNAIFISPRNTSKPYKGYKTGRKIKFSNADYELLKEKFGPKIEYISARVYKNFNVSYKESKDAYNIRAVHPDHQYLEKTKVVYGRYIHQKDIKRKEKFAVIGRLVETDLFKRKSGLGKYINVQGIMFKVIGVFEDDGGDNEERLIYIPISTAQTVYAKNDYINQLNLTYNPKMDFDAAIQFGDQISKILKEKYAVAPKDQSAIRIFNLADNYKKNTQMMFVIGLLILFIGFGTLIAGVVGISNIMVYIVKERTKELGIRKVLGAQPKSIVNMILLESILITSIAGYIGIFIGVFSLKLIDNSLETYFIKDPSVSNGIIISAALVLIVAGVIAGYVPAKRAAHIKPITALRDE